MNDKLARIQEQYLKRIRSKSEYAKKAVKKGLNNLIIPNHEVFDGQHKTIPREVSIRISQREQIL